MIRLTRGTSYSDKLRKYKIYIDDVYRGDIKINEVKEYEVDNGNHSIYAKIDWCRSNILNIDINNSKLELEVGSSLIGWRILFSIIYITFLKNNYLWIRKKDDFTL